MADSFSFKDSKRYDCTRVTKESRIFHSYTWILSKSQSKISWNKKQILHAWYQKSSQRTIEALKWQMNKDLKISMKEKQSLEKQSDENCWNNGRTWTKMAVRLELKAGFRYLKMPTVSFQAFTSLNFKENSSDSRKHRFMLFNLAHVRIKSARPTYTRSHQWKMTKQKKNRFSLLASISSFLENFMMLGNEKKNRKHSSTKNDIQNAETHIYCQSYHLVSESKAGFD